MTSASTFMISVVCLLSCSGAAHTDVSLRVSPERSQFFEYESISLSCEGEGSSTLGWTVIRNTSGRVDETCNTEWGATRGGSCVTQDLNPLDSGVYWCQSKEGELSRSINITISDGDVILEIPLHPAAEGSDVTLRCLSKNKTTGAPSSGLPAAFYKDGSFIRAESTGQMTIHSVSTSDEGFYKCNISGLGESPESQVDMDVTDSPASKDKDQPFSLPPYFYPLTGAAVSIFLLLLALCVWMKCRGRRADSQTEDVRLYANVNVKQDKHRKRESSRAKRDADQVYSNME